MLAQIEWHAAVVEGGYKAYRKLVLRELEGLGTREFHVISGLTGTGKVCAVEAGGGLSVASGGGGMDPTVRAATAHGWTVGGLGNT